MMPNANRSFPTEVSRPGRVEPRHSIDNGKPHRGSYEAFKYAPLEEIDKHLRPLLAEENMDLSYSDEPREGGEILIRGRLKRLPGGHYEDSFMPAPPDTSGGKYGPER
jgi:hypothetical protein